MFRGLGIRHQNSPFPGPAAANVEWRMYSIFRSGHGTRNVNRVPSIPLDMYPLVQQSSGSAGGEKVACDKCHRVGSQNVAGNRQRERLSFKQPAAAGLVLELVPVR